VTLPVAILAGGRATRLGDLARDTPKSLIDVAGRPFVAHQLALLARHGVTDVVFCIGHLGDQIQATVADGSGYGIRVVYSDEGAVPLGTGGALRRALPLLGEAFCVLYGDSYLECDYQAVGDAFAASGRLGLLTVFLNEDRWDRSNAAVTGTRVVQYSKEHRTPDMRYIDYGLSVLRAEALRPYPAGAALDLARIYEDLVARDELAAYEVTDRFYEIGGPGGLAETRRHLEQPR
jgi:NDP-sugar pyrophosphorylase family protein